MLVAAADVHGEEPERPLVSALLSERAAYEVSLRLFREGLGDGGRREGRDVAIEELAAEGAYESLVALAADAVARRVALIAAFGLPAALAAKAATTTIPIVMMIGADPVELGLVASLRAPGGNITGVTQFFGELGGKRLDLLLELLPQARVVAILINRENPNATSHLRNITAAAAQRGRQLDVIHAASAEEVDAAFAGFAARGAQALLVADDPFLGGQMQRIAALSARYSLPTVSYNRRHVEAGGLMSYGVDPAFAYRQGGVYAARILAGARPATLPVLQPTSFELVINLRTARALGLTVPATLLARADAVIE